MIDIVSVGYEKTRLRIRFTCHWCGCIFDADKADYTKSEECTYPYNNAYLTRYAYKSRCPLCGSHLYEAEKDVQFWEYTDWEDGTASSRRIDPYEAMKMI